MKRLIATTTAILTACAVCAVPAIASDDVAQHDSVTQTPSQTETPTTPPPTTQTPTTETPTTTPTPTTETPTTTPTTTTTTTATPTTTTTTTTPVLTVGDPPEDDGDTLLNSLLDSSADDCDDGTCDVPAGDATLGTGVGPAVVAGRGTGLPYTGPGDEALPLLLALIMVLGGITLYRYTSARDQLSTFEASLPRKKVRGYDSGYGWALSRLVSRSHLAREDEDEQ